MTEDKLTGTKTQPAVGQVWRLHGEERLTWAIARVDPDGLCVFGGNDGEYRHRDVLMRAETGWRCIGIETPAGRVMVGERRTRRETWTIDAVIGGEKVLMSCPEAPHQYEVRAEAVASWPLLPPTTPDAEATEREPEPIPFDAVTFGGIACPPFSIVSDPVYVGGQLVGKTRGVITGECKVVFAKAPRPTPSADPREQGPGCARSGSVGACREC